MARFCNRFEAGLAKPAQGLTAPRGEKRIDRIQERIGRLKAASRGAGQHYTVTLETDATEHKASIRRSNAPMAICSSRCRPISSSR